MLLFLALLNGCVIIPNKERMDLGNPEACDNKYDDDGNGLIDDGCDDYDGDGFDRARDGDCDETDPEVNPGATEICDGADNNCDGAIDEGAAVDAVAWYLDADGDGYGDGTASLLSCTQPRGYVVNVSGRDGYDCDDNNANINPSATEVCDDRDTDEDCDGSADDADDGATGQSAWYPDRDDDGYGDPNVSTAACEQPTEFVANKNDCDDGDGAINPAATEVCNGYDDDCDVVTGDEDVCKE